LGVATDLVSVDCTEAVPNPVCLSVEISVDSRVDSTRDSVGLSDSRGRICRCCFWSPHHLQMNYHNIENAILTASSERDLEKIESLKMHILSRKTKLDYFISRFLEDFDFDIAVNDTKTRFYNSICSEYGAINRLLRIINHYAK
jgi:hypothetical protein